MSLKIRRGTDAERLTITPAEGELIYTTDTRKLYVGDNATAGGVFVTGTGYTGSAGGGGAGGGYTGSIGYTGSVPSGPAGYVGSFKGTLWANDSTVLFNAADKNIHANNISLSGSVIGTTFATAYDANTSSIQHPMFIGNNTDPSGLYIITDTTTGSTVTLHGVGGSGLGGGSSINFETSGSNGSLSSSTQVLENDTLGIISWRGLNTFENKYDFVSGLISQVSEVGSSISGNLFVAVSNTDGNFKRFNFANNGTFTTYNSIIGDGGSSETPTDTVAEATLDIRGTMKLSIQTSVPNAPVDGMIAVADGNTAGWDPKGTNAGISYPCYYDGTVWNPLY